MTSQDPQQSRPDAALAALRAGATVGGGRFTLIRQLGQGGMAVVWLARDEHLHEDVALKFLPPEIRHDAVALDDLRRETSRSRKLSHPHIIRLHDLYKSDDEAFISMEYVDGSNLSEVRLEQPGRVFNWTFLEPIVKQLCDALEYAHREHVIHRDLKPANMMLDRRGRLKLADFGLAATVSDSMSRVSMGNHAFSGTASYMSPQQLNGELPQVTDDIYALGSTLYELITSRAPFFTGDIAHQVRSMPAQPVEKRLAQLRIENPIPPQVSATIMACLAKEAEKRPQSIRDVAEQMGLRPPESRQQPETAPPALPGAAPAKPRHDPAPQRPSRRPKLAAALVLIALCVGGSLWWISHRTDSPTSLSEPTNTAAGAPTNSQPHVTASRRPQFLSMFNGRDLSEWDGDPAVWSVKDGAIVATAGTSRERRPRAIFWRGDPVEDFELHLSFKLEMGNSGIYYRAKHLTEFEVGGYQYELLPGAVGLLIETGSDRTRRDPARLGAETTADFVNGKNTVVVERTFPRASRFRSNEWNEVVISVRGNHIVHELNGDKVVEVTDEFEGRPRRGLIALEVYGERTTVRFRNIRLKRLSAD